MAEVRVVIVHHGDPAPSLRCLSSLVADTSRAERSMLVVDNSGTLDAASLPDGVGYLRCLDNPGFGAGANRGLAALPPARAEGHAAYVLLNHDVEVAPGFLDAAVEALRETTVGAAAGPLRRDRVDGPLWYAGGGVHWLSGTVWQSRSAADAGRARDVGFLPGAALAVAPGAWHDVGGFDSRIFLYHEDLDLCLRLRRAGWRLRFVPGMAAVHHLGSATGSGRSSPFYLEHMARTRFLPHRSTLYRLYLALLHTGWVVARASYMHLRNQGADRERSRALWRGHRDALQQLFSRRPSR